MVTKQTQFRDHEAYLHLDGALDDILHLPQHLEIGYGGVNLTQYVTK